LQLHRWLCIFNTIGPFAAIADGSDPLRNGYLVNWLTSELLDWLTGFVLCSFREGELIGEGVLDGET
jgi:hypothetical protein